MADFSELFQKILQEKNLLDDLQNKKKPKNDDTLRDIALLANVQSIFDKVGENERNAELIRALKPLLSKDLQVKADEAIKMLKIFSLIPMLKENNILN